MQRLSNSRWFGPVLFVVALLFQAAVMRRQITWYDEALELYDAERVLHGGLPYRDFWTLYGPAQFYLLAIFLKLFGITVLTGRFYDALIKSGIACLCFILVRRLADARWALAAFFIALLCLTCTMTAIYNFPIFPALLCGLSAIFYLSRSLAEPHRRSPLFVSGLLTGLATTFRHDSGFYICVAIATTILWSRATCTNHDPNVTPLTHRLATYLGGVLLIVLPVLVWLLVKVPHHDLYYDLIYVPSRIYPVVRTLPFPRLRDLLPYLHPFGRMTFYATEDWIVYLPILVCATAFAALIATMRSQDATDPERYRRLTFGALTLLAALLYIKGLVRVTELHQMQTIVTTSALTLILLAGWRTCPRVVRLPVLTCGVLFAVYAALLLWHAENYIRFNVRDLLHTGSPQSLSTACHPPRGLERTRCLLLDPTSAAAIEYVQQLTTATDPIYVGAGRHDRLLSSDVRFYVVSGRSSITKWYDLHPGVQTTQSIQEEMIESLRTKAPKVIVLNEAFDEIDEPNASRTSSGVTVLDDYIRAHYKLSAQFGPYFILVPD